MIKTDNLHVYLNLIPQDIWLKNILKGNTSLHFCVFQMGIFYTDVLLLSFLLGIQLNDLFWMLLMQIHFPTAKKDNFMPD